MDAKPSSVELDEQDESGQSGGDVGVSIGVAKAGSMDEAASVPIIEGVEIFIPEDGAPPGDYVDVLHNGVSEADKILSEFSQNSSFTPLPPAPQPSHVARPPEPVLDAPSSYLSAPKSVKFSQTLAALELTMKDEWDDEDEAELIYRSKTSLDRHLTTSFRKSAAASFLKGDREALLRENMVTLQYNLMKIAFEGEEERHRLEATKFALGQMGLGTVQKYEHTMNYEQMPTTQLMSMIAGKLQSLKRLNPQLEVTTLLKAVAQDEEGVPIYSVDAQPIEGDSGGGVKEGDGE